MTINPRRALALSLALATLALPLAACGGADEETTTAAEGGPVASEAWARQSPAMADMGAAYLVLAGGAEADALVGVSVPTEIAAEAQIHETVAVEEDAEAMGDHSMGDDTMSMEGAMTMRQVERIEIPAGETVMLEPGGYHVMLMGLAKPLTAGEAFELTLDFETAPDAVVEVAVRES